MTDKDAALKKLQRKYPVTCRIVPWLSPPPPVVEEPIPETPARESWPRRLFRPFGRRQSPVPEPLVSQPERVDPFNVNVRDISPIESPEIVGDRHHPAVRVIRRRGIPASRLTSTDKNRWKDLILRHYDVSPQSYVFLCLFPQIPDLTFFQHYFDQHRLEMTFTLPEEQSAAVNLCRLMVLKDLKTSTLIRISQPLQTAGPSADSGVDTP